MKVRILELAGHVVSMCGGRTERKYLWGNKMEEQKHENQNYGGLHYIESDLNSMGVKMWRKEAQDKF
jgi:hypothetical protein